MVELVDTTDLNSVDPNGSCGFKSRSGYKQNASPRGVFSLVLVVRLGKRDIQPMKRLCFLVLGLASLVQCKTPEESVVGTFVLDSEVGCSTCVETGPEVMSFEEDATEGMLRGYRFEFDGGAYHEGLYEFVYLESSVVLVLYPETASVEHFGLIGSVLQSNYRVGQRAIREQCNGLLDCVWRREGG